MAIKRWIPGFALQTSQRGLVLSDRAPLPPILLRSLASGATVPVTAVRQVPSAPLAAKHIDVYALTAEGLDPGTAYRWEGAGMPAAEISTLPRALPAEGLRFVVGSCLYGYASGQTARHVASLKSLMTRERPAFRLLIGDNVYLDVAPDQRTFEDGPTETVERYLPTASNEGCGGVSI